MKCEEVQAGRTVRWMAMSSGSSLEPVEYQPTTSSFGKTALSVQQSLALHFSISETLYGALLVKKREKTEKI
jgi:hypothetical protein